MATGQLTASQATIEPARNAQHPVSVLFFNGDTGTDTVTLQVVTGSGADSGNARTIFAAPLGAGESAIITGIQLGPADLLQAAATNAAVVNYATFPSAQAALPEVNVYSSTGSKKASSAATSGLPPAQFKTQALTTGTLAAGQASGANICVLANTNATPGAQAMRTPAQILADNPGLLVGQSYLLRVLNLGTNPFTLATDSGAGFTMTGTMTIALNTWRDFVVTINTATTGTVQQVGIGTSS